MSIKKQFQDIRPSYVLLTKRETYKDFSTEELRSLFLEEMQMFHKKLGGSDSSYPTQFDMNREELIDCSIKYHEILLEAIDKQLK